jgi:hypothetical protein
MGIRFTACAVALVVTGLAGCGGSSAESERIAALEARVEAAESEAANETDDSVAEAADTAGSEYADDSDTGGGTDCIQVPDVVGKDHQLAQDTMQAAGLYALAEEDASGQDRLLMLDRNWTTVEQRPEAGECVAQDTEVLLSALKDDER